MTYTLNDIRQKLDNKNLLSSENGLPDTVISSITFDSKQVKAGTLFFCKGINFKVEYLEKAINAGAIGYVSEINYAVNLPLIHVTDIRQAMPAAASLFYNNPFEAFNLIGITGTKGKTTTTYYLKNIFDRYEASLNKVETAFLTSTEVYDGVNRGQATLTTPESLDLFKHFDNAKNQGIEFLTMEVSSQALKYQRVQEVMFDIVAFLNISEDHISPNEHPTFEDYFNSKLQLFNYGPKAVINIDAEYSEEIIQAAKNNPANKEIITISRHDNNADYYANNIVSSFDGQSFELTSPDYRNTVKMAMTGEFNVENALVSIAIARQFDVPYDIILTSLSEVTASGRMEVFKTANEQIKVIVDFAHNKLSFEQLFNAAKKMYPEHQYHIVFGAPGNKGISRRSDLAVVAAQEADEIYITMDDPDFETAEVISDVILKNVVNAGSTAIVIIDRVEAINMAFKNAEQSEKPVVLLVAGKGNDGFMKIKGKREPYLSDVHYVEANIDQYNQANEL